MHTHYNLSIGIHFVQLWDKLYLLPRDSGLEFSSRSETIKHGIISFVYQGGKQWNALPGDAKDIGDLNVFKNYIDKWTGPDCHCGYCVLCAIKTL